MPRIDKDRRRIVLEPHAVAAAKRLLPEWEARGHAFILEENLDGGGEIAAPRGLNRVAEVAMLKLAQEHLSPYANMLLYTFGTDKPDPEPLLWQCDLFLQPESVRPSRRDRRQAREGNIPPPIPGW